MTQYEYCGVSNMLNRMQQAGFERAKKWWADGNEQIFKIAGYAGTGKTYLSSVIAEELAGERIAFCAFTGKAALVMRQRGMPATTIHALIYNMEMRLVPHKNGYKRKLVPVLKERLEPKPSLILVDESSMVSEKILDDLLSFDIPVIAVGDPFQLPPVGSKDSDLLMNPNVILEEIMRQDEGSAIVYLAEKIRKGLPLNDDESAPGCIWQMSKRTVDDDTDNIFKWADQIIAGRNATVAKINQMAREYLGFTDTLPMIGDKIICKRNDWGNILLGEKIATALVNGLIGYCTAIHETETLDKVPWKDEPVRSTEYSLNLRPTFEEKAEFRGIVFDPDSFYENKENRQYMKKMIFQFAYCITCHAAQGSEWDNIILYDDSWPDAHDPLFQARWRYTGVTRAAKRLVWLR